MTADPRDGSFRIPDGAPPDRLDRALKLRRPELSWQQVRQLIARGKVTVDGAVAVDPGAAVAGGAEVAVEVARRNARPTTTKPGFGRDRILHLDRDVVVVDKPSGLQTVPWGEDHDALDRRLGAELGRPVRVVQRLDRDTSGVLVFARNEAAERALAAQFRERSTQRRYLALVHGDAASCTIRTHLAEDRGDGLRGSIANPALGKLAITHARRVEALRGATLVECRLETGRTHQIRIHLAERGHMLLGERGYVRDHQGPVIAAPRVMLHAAELGFAHPTTGEPLAFVAQMPPDMQAALEQLRG